MRLTTLGVIAITSTLTFACTTTVTTETEPGSTAPATSKPDDPAGGWRSKLAFSRPDGKASTVAALSRKLGGAPKLAGPFPRLRSGPAPAGSCGLSTGDATCDTCLDASCCTQNTACVSDADCTALITCGDACRDDACFSACMSAHPTGAALLDTLSTCVGTSCSTACGGGSSSPPPTSTCGFGSGDATCDTCLDTNCCGAANACLGDAACTDLIDCAGACADAACESACMAAHPTGMAKITALSTCADTACGTTCGGPSSGPGPGGPGPGPGPGSCGLTSGDATCDTCLDASCCAQTTTCLGDADCVAIVGCYNACSDATCAAACDAAHPTGSSKLTAVGTCVQASCATTCGF